MEKCGYPGCKNRIKASGSSGLCLDHIHTPGWCRCVFCLDKFVERPPENLYPGTRTVMMKEPTSTSYVFTEKPIRLPLEPWHDKV